MIYDKGYSRVACRHGVSHGAIAVALVTTAVLASPAMAANAQQSPNITKEIGALQQQIQALQNQLQNLEQQVKQSQDEAHQAQAQAAQAAQKVSAPPPAAPGPKVIESSSHQFGLSSADGKNTIELTGRYQMDYGSYVNYEKRSPASSPNDLNSGVNARRARIGVTGKFGGDWNYTLIYDLGGSSDTLNPLISGAPASGIQIGMIEYAGLKPLYFQLGYMDVPFTLDEANSSNDIMFMERPSMQAVAANLAAGDFRSGFGAKYNTDQLWVGGYLTGPTSGAAHTLTLTTLNPGAATTSSVACPVTGATATCTVPNSVYNAALGGSAEQLGIVGRVGYQILQTDQYTLHIGGDAGELIQPPHTTAGVRGVSFSDRPELRIDPTSLVSSGTILFVKNASVYGGEAAGNFGPLYFQGEYYDVNVNREGALPDLNFDGGYVEAAYTFTGESRKYIPGAGAYSRITPANPLGFDGNGFTGFGAWELAARYSAVNLNDKFTLVKNVGVEGGYQEVYTVGLNWYPTANVRFDFEYLHGTVDKLNGAGAQIGQRLDAVAARAQFVW